MKKLKIKQIASVLSSNHTKPFSFISLICMFGITASIIGFFWFDYFLCIKSFFSFSIFLVYCKIMIEGIERAFIQKVEAYINEDMINTPNQTKIQKKIKELIELNKDEL